MAQIYLRYYLLVSKRSTVALPYIHGNGTFAPFKVTVAKTLNYYKSTFFFGKMTNTRKKYRLVKYSSGILSVNQNNYKTQLQNKCLLSKWLFKIDNHC
jgi:hypothetical protein